jgi:hypothetical protein
MGQKLGERPVLLNPLPKEKTATELSVSEAV